jgi:hypothetical protein
MTSHGGFLIPNADGVSSTKMSEPDQIDFNILGNNRWGVISGCGISISGTVASTVVGSNGTALVDGAIVTLTGGQSITLGAGGSQPRFDLVGVDSAGTLVSVVGTPAVDPVYPDVPTSVTVLAAVYCPTGSSTFDATYTDKRNMLQPVFVSTVNGTGPVLLNRYSGNDVFRIDGNGRLEWNNSDTYLYRSSAGVLRAHSDLLLDGSLTATNGTFSGDVSAVGDIMSSNLRIGSTFPTAPKGTILQYTGGGSSQGKVYIQTSATSTMNWEEVSTSSTAHQPGDIKQSTRSPAQMPGWLPFVGQTVTEEQHPSLFLVDGLQQFIVNGSPRTMTLPDARNRVLMSTDASVGVTGGSNSVTLTKSNLPAHKHDVSVQPAGSHTHPATTSGAGGHAHGTLAGGGKHSHPVVDPGHKHGAANIGQGFITVNVAGDSNLDSVQSDMSHSWRTGPQEYTATAKTGISISSSGDHTHVTDNVANHTHPVNVTAEPAHSHTASEVTVGDGTPISVVPPYLTVYTYIKV